MADEKKYYCFCGSNCKYETMTKEQILAAIAQAVATGSVGNCDAGFVTKIKEQNSGGSVTFWVGTQAQYNAIAEKAKNCMYIITDDTTTADTKAAFAAAVAAAEEAAALATAAAAAVMPIDISDQLTFTLDTKVQTITKLSVSTLSRRFVYSPATKTVFFTLYCAVKGSAAAGNSFSIRLGDKYLPSDNPEYMGFSVASSNAKVRAEVSRGEHIKVIANQAIEDFEDLDITLTGWYFCEGE